MQIQPLMTISDLAKRLNLSTSTIRAKVKAKKWGEIPKPKPMQKLLRWCPAEVEAFINGEIVYYNEPNKNIIPPEFAKYC